MATMQDIARETGLSAMTVSRVLSKKGYVSERSRKLVLAAAKKRHYEVNLLARQLSHNRTCLIGIIVPFKGFLGTYYLGQVMQGIQQSLSGTDYHMALFDSESEDFNEGRKCANLCRQRRVDGLIVVAPGVDDRFPLTFANLSMPLVVVGGLLQHRKINCVDVDNLGAAAAVTEHLIRLGHTKIGFLSGPSHLRNAAEREQGFRKTMAAHRIPVVEKWILQGEYETRKAFHVALELLSKKERPTALFAANDMMAYGVLDAARLKGLNVPDDLSVVGFDDLEASAECIPSLTTATQPMKRLGQVAARHILDMLNESNRRVHTLRERLPAGLVIRASSAPPSSKPR
jgi:DNA-binding LacI/PurR family transcriptional regulator